MTTRGQHGGGPAVCRGAAQDIPPATVPAGTQCLQGAAAGLACATGAYFLLTAQDAAIKLTVAKLPVAEALCLRSLVILVICLYAGGRHMVVQAVLSRSRLTLLARAALAVAAWGCYFLASRTLPLPELSAIFLIAPLLVAIMAPRTLGEEGGVRIWGAAGFGFLGVAVAIHPHWAAPSSEVLLAFAAAAIWATGMLLTRRIARTERTLVQTLYINVAFVLMGGGAALSDWHAPGPMDTVLLVTAGVLGGLGQVALFHAAARIPAASVAVLQYSSLIWAILITCAGTRDVPAAAEMAGAALIGLSGAVLWLPAAQQGRRLLAAMPSPPLSPLRRN